MHALHITCDDETIIQNLCDDTREIAFNSLFIARKGHHQEELNKNISTALNKGAKVLTDAFYIHHDVYRCEDIEAIIMDVITVFYNDDWDELYVVGVSGTSGKTSVASMIAQLLNHFKGDVMQIGTGFVKYLNTRITTHNTTPGIFQLAKYISLATQNKIKYVVMEVSSHAIDQNRIGFIRFDCIVFTNIREDHLDYHLSKTHYLYTKFKLRRYLKKDGIIIYNGDLPYMHELRSLTYHKCIVYSCTQAHYVIEHIHLYEQESVFELQGNVYRSPYIGMFNVYNIVSAIILMRHVNINALPLSDFVANMQLVKGRMEVIKGENYTIWLDYAHTEDALHQILCLAKQLKKNRIVTLIGCGGDRDKRKRPLMAQCAMEFSDQCIFTCDNPRNESIHDIIFDMLPLNLQHVRIFEHRYYAIKYCIKNAQKDDIIIIAGKGDEEIMEIKQEKYSFSDRAIIHEFLGKE